MDPRQLQSKAAAFPYLQGLLSVPIGLFLLAVGAGQVVRDPAGPWLMVGGALVALASYVPITRYYANHYGRISRNSSHQLKDVVMAVVGVVVIIGGTIVDENLDLPISGYAAAYALVMLLYVHLTIGLKVHHLLVWGGLLAVSVVPVWNSMGIEREVPLSLLPMGIATIAAGLFDHALLVRTFGRPSDLSVDGNGA